MLGKLLLTNGIKWRYEVYRIEYRMNPIVACLMTIRNMWYGVVKWIRGFEPLSKSLANRSCVPLVASDQRSSGQET